MAVSLDDMMAEINRATAGQDPGSSGAAMSFFQDPENLCAG